MASQGVLNTIVQDNYHIDLVFLVDNLFKSAMQFRPAVPVDQGRRTDAIFFYELQGCIVTNFPPIIPASLKICFQYYESLTFVFPAVKFQWSTIATGR